ncbi:hypothetical protein [Nonomuraea coxensis]|nr:hypothetical protein [Nonomuraea coxensis]
MTPVRLGALAMAAVALLASCAGPPEGPTAAQAGETLKAHITQLMGDAGLKQIEVTDPGGRDVPCAGGTKRTYGVSADVEGGDGTLLEMTGRLTGMLGYRVDMAAATASHRTVFKRDSSRTTVVLDLPAEHRLTVAGETDCVPAGDG